MPENDRPATTDTAPSRVAVCVCTYRRPEGLERLLDALCSQVFDDVAPPAVDIIVADNECSDTNRAICERHARACRFAIQYLQEKRRGISHARNACLDRLPEDCDFVAMIDDDEIPSPGWLNHLLHAQQKTSADIVTGPTLPVFNDDAPDWLVASGYFAKPHHPESYRDLQAFPPTATCNVLIRASVFTAQGLRFDPRLALSGSEDKLFFQDLKQRGLTFVWAAGARVEETVPAERATLRYMLSEALRRGSTKFYVKVRLKTKTPTAVYKMAFRSVLRGIYGILSNSGALLYQLAGGRRRRHEQILRLLAIAENTGFIGGVFGYRRKHY